jgi:hypothetical protein
MVCEVCYRSGRAQHQDRLTLVAGPALPTQTPPAGTGGDTAADALTLPAASGQLPLDQAVRAVEGEGETVLEVELLQLKEKHGAGSRLEGCMLELVAERSRSSGLEQQLAAAEARAAAAEALVEQLRARRESLRLDLSRLR